MRQVFRAGALGRPRGIGWGGRWEGGSGWATHVNPWLIHVNVWQKPLQYCKVISLQLIKINEKKKKLSAEELMLLDSGVRKDFWGSLGLQGDSTSSSCRRPVLGVHWKDWCWSWNSKTLVTWCEELIHLKRSWCWERLKVGGEGDDRGWDGWMASLTHWT